jgi:hypothetical protein
MSKRRRFKAKRRRAVRRDAINWITLDGQFWKWAER